MAHDTVISRPCCLFVQWRLKIGQNRGGSVITLAPTRPYLSAQCDIVCNCCSSVPITYEHLTTLAVYYHFCVGLDLECSFSVKSKRSIRVISHPRHQICPLHPKPDVKTNNNRLVCLITEYSTLLKICITPYLQQTNQQNIWIINKTGLVVLAKQLFWTVFKKHLWSYCCICSIYYYCHYKV